MSADKKALASECTGQLLSNSNSSSMRGARNQSSSAIARRLTGSRCQCSRCGEYFNSVSVFDRHRIGNWEAEGVYRRCLSILEMLSRGWRLNRRGFWIERQRIDAPRRRRDPGTPATDGREAA
jgi:hypothetical protein